MIQQYTSELDPGCIASVSWLDQSKKILVGTSHDNQKSDNEKTEASLEPSKPQTSSLEAERKTAQKFISGTAQSLIQWMPLGGSGGMLISFLIHQDWVMAIVTFPVTIVTVIWAAYTESFLTTLREVYKERGRQDANSLMTLLTTLDETMRWQLARTANKYLRCQGNACRDYHTEGYNQPSGIFMPLLEEVFVPLELSNQFITDPEGRKLPSLPGYRRKNRTSRSPEQDSLDIWDLLSRSQKKSAFRRLVIQAWGGFGKTTLLKHITHIYYTKKSRRYQAPQLLPVLLYLRQWHKIIVDDSPDLSTLIEKYHIPNLPEGKDLKLPPSWVINQLKKGRMLVMLDGFDEIHEQSRIKVSQWIGDQMKQYSKTVFIVTSRPRAFENYCKSHIKPGIELSIIELNAEQQQDFISKWYSAQERYIRGGRNTPEVKDLVEKKTNNLINQLEEQSALSAFADNPLLLNMIVNLHRFYQGNPLPTKRAELYQSICQLQLNDRPKNRGIEMLLPGEDSQALLQSVALYLVQEIQGRQIEHSKLIEFLENQLNTERFEENIEAESFLSQIEQVSELLVRREEDYEFAHLSLQNYLAAKQIEDKEQQQLLLENYSNQWWRETIQLYAAQLKPTHFNQFISQLCDIATPDAIDLAYSCLFEYSREVNSTLKARVQDLRYQPLEDYLKNQQWQEADEETLKVMLQTVGKGESQILTPNDIQTFPCEDLCRINELWVKYSNGRFGFSVQKKIYLACGAKPDGLYPGEKIFGNFGNFVEQVGWMDFGNEVWMGDGRMTILQFAPEGYLPRRIFRSGGQGTGFKKPYNSALLCLFSRREL